MRARPEGVYVRFTKEEKAQLETEAKLVKVSLAELVRWRAVAPPPPPPDPNVIGDSNLMFSIRESQQLTVEFIKEFMIYAYQAEGIQRGNGLFKRVHESAVRAAHKSGSKLRDSD